MVNTHDNYVNIIINTDKDSHHRAGVKTEYYYHHSFMYSQNR